MKVQVLSLGVVDRDGSPRIHFPPGQYEVADDVAAALRAQGVLAPEPEAPATDTGKGAATGGKGKGA